MLFRSSVGSAVGPRDGATVETLMRNADLALYRSKDEGGGQHCTYEPALHAHAEERRQLEFAMRHALERGEFSLVYQPVVDATSEEVLSFEALLRWTSADHGFISPAKFIPLAEETGLIGEIGDWVLGEAIADIERWRRKYDCTIELSVNISPVQFERQGPLPWLERILRSELPSCITVEITEGVLVSDAGQVSRCLGALHEAGARVSIDDFGTGFSSLAYLKHFDVDYLKIDKSFIDQLADDDGDKALTEAIVDRKSTRLNSSHVSESRMPSSA